MKIDQAFSLDTNEVIDPELAYDYFWAGMIKDKRDFACPAENCYAAITCANLDKLRHDMKLDPYYKTIGEHEPLCELVRDYEIKSLSVDTTNGTRHSLLNKQNGLPDVFELSRPKSHAEISDNESLNTSSFPPNAKKKKKSGRSYDSQQASRHYTVRAFVSKYIKYRAAGVASERFIKIKGYDVAYDDFFVEISSQDLTKISKYPRIYFGKVFMNARKESDYAAIFENNFLSDGQPIRPSIYISESVIDNAFTKRLYKEKLKALTEKKYPAVWVFVYGVPKTVTAGDKTYININISNMDFFDMREEINF